MADKFNNEGRVSLWNKVSQSGKKYKSGTITINGVDYNFSLFDNDNKVEGDNRPDYTGKIRDDR